MIFVTCPTGIEQLLVDELKELGVLNARKGFRGVYVPQEMELRLQDQLLLAPGHPRPLPAQAVPLQK